jgi:transcriptional regulator with XRE-family HTH domain
MARSTHHQEYQAFLGLLRDLRVDAGVTQIMLAKKLSNTQTFISKVERGERRLDLVEFVEVCEALGMDPRAAFEEFLARRRGRRAPAGKLAGQRRTK